MEIKTAIAFGISKAMAVFYFVQRPEAPQGSTSPLSFTGSPISSKVTFPPNLSVSTEPRIYPITEGERPVV